MHCIADWTTGIKGISIWITQRTRTEPSKWKSTWMTKLTQNERLASIENPTELRNEQRQNDLLQKKFQLLGVGIPQGRYLPGSRVIFESENVFKEMKGPKFSLTLKYKGVSAALSEESWQKLINQKKIYIKILILKKLT